MTSRRDGLTLAERSALSGVGRERAAGARHLLGERPAGRPGSVAGPAGRVGAARRRVVRPRGVRRGRRRPGRAGRGLGARRAPRAGRAVRLCPHCSSRRAHCRTHGRAASWLRVLPAPPAAPAVAGVPRHRDVPAQPRTAAARRTPSASGCGRAASGARTYRFGLNLSAAPPPSRRRDCARVEASERRFLDEQRGPEHRSCYTGPRSARPGPTTFRIM
jgi:hypothetical protein